MSAPTGGLRDRVIFESVHRMLRAALDDLGWFVASEVDVAVSFIAEPIDNEQQVPFNTIALSAEDTTGADAEMGSVAQDDSHQMYVDVYAESDWVGKYISGDIRDALRGLHPSIGRVRPTIDVYEWDAATPVYLFSCDVQAVSEDRAHDFPEPWRQHWWSIRFEVVDEVHGNEEL